MSTFHPVASEFQEYNIDDHYDSIQSSFTSAVFIKTRTYVCHGITAHTLWGFHAHGEHGEALAARDGNKIY